MRFLRVAAVVVAAFSCCRLSHHDPGPRGRAAGRRSLHLRSRRALRPARADAHARAAQQPARPGSLRRHLRLGHRYALRRRRRRHVGRPGHEDGPADRFDDAGAWRQPAGHRLLRHRGRQLRRRRHVRADRGAVPAGQPVHLCRRRRAAQGRRPDRQAGHDDRQHRPRRTLLRSADRRLHLRQGEGPRVHLPDADRFQRRHRHQRIANRHRIPPICFRRRCRTWRTFRTSSRSRTCHSCRDSPTKATC